MLIGWIIFILLGWMPVFAAEHHPEEFLASIQGSKTAGKQIYTHFCANCHSEKPLIPVGAPTIGVKSAWAPYIEKNTVNGVKTEENIVDQMIKTIDPGVGAMPPRGGCFECSDEDLRAAIVYMLPKPKNK